MTVVAAPSGDPPISVAGGVAGHQALTEDLWRAQKALDQAVGEIDHVTWQLTFASNQLEEAEALAADDVRPALYQAQYAVRAAIHGPGSSNDVAGEVADASDRLGAVAVAYEEAEAAANHHVSGAERAWRGARDLFLTVTWPNRVAQGVVWRVSPVGSLVHATGNDAIGDVLMPDGPPPTTGYLNGDSVEWLLGPLGAIHIGNLSLYQYIVAALIRTTAGLEWFFGEPQPEDVRPRLGVTTGPGPGGVADLIAGIEAVDLGSAGAVSIQTITHEDGTQSHIVSIPGTADHTLWDDSQQDWNTNLVALHGGPNHMSQLVVDAIAAAGIGPDEEIMLVGHSQGGIVAAGLAAHADHYDLNVTHVVTAGSPTDQIAKPDTVQYLHLDSLQEVVDGVDGKSTIDAPNVTSVTADLESAGNPELVAAGGTLLGAHALSTYQAIGRSADASTHASLRAWKATASSFLSGDPSVTREYEPTFPEKPEASPSRRPRWRS